MILSGSFTGRRYRVNGKLPPDPAKHFARALGRHAFKAIDLGSDRTRSVGWVNARQILDASLTWDKVVFGPHVVVGLRVDQRRVSRPILRARLAQAESDHRREQPGRRLGREERDRLAKAIEAELLARTPPTTTVHELAWNTATGLAWFSSTADKANQEMEELFEKTFELTLVPLVPYVLAERWTEAHGRGGSALDRAMPLDLRPRP